MGNGEFISTSILQKALELPAGCYIFRLSGEGYSGNDLPPVSNSYKYGTACIYKRSNTSIIVVLYGEAISSPMAINSYLTKWSGWQTYITNTDLFAKGLGSSNLNEIKSPGIYVQNYSANATTEGGYPVEDAGFLEVMAIENKGFVLQKYNAHSSSAVYKRTYTNSGWNGWKQI